MAKPHDFYAEDGWTRVLEGVQGCTRVEANTDDFVWVVYADVREECDRHATLGRGQRGLTMLHEGDLRGLTDPQFVHGGLGPYGIGRWIGGLGHELGHAFGLSHPSSRDCDALMYTGYMSWPDAYLREDDKKILMQSPAFR